MVLLPEVEWLEPQPLAIPADLSETYQRSPLLASLLVQRGITSKDRALSFLDPMAYSPASPFDIPDMDKAVERIRKAIQHGEKIGIWGDFDVDGQTSTAILVKGLRSLGAQVHYHVPVRATESHGINLPNLRKMISAGTKLIVTCDTGVTAFDAAEYCQSEGVDLIITDHHTPESHLPVALAVVTTQRLPVDHPLRPLCGSATAWQVIRALESDPDSLCDLAALGMVADVATLIDDGRWITQIGLARLQSHPRVGLQTILDRAGASNSGATDLISYTLAPRLNALGRLGDANPAVELLLTEDKEFAMQMADEIEILNRKRKSLVESVLGAAMNQLESHRELAQQEVIVLSHPQWPASVVGIVASRIAELYYRPVILLVTPPDGIARGSARSIKGVNIIEAISACSQFLISFGGHPGAAGLSLPATDIPGFTRAVQKAVAIQTEGKPSALQVSIDAFVPFSDLDLDWLEQLAPLEPFGPGNPPLTFATRNVEIRDMKEVGHDSEHLVMMVADESQTVQKVMWWQGANLPKPEGRFDLAFTAGVHDYKGNKSIQLTWLNARTVENQVLPVIPVVSGIRNHDRRMVTDIQNEISKLANQADTIIWREGEAHHSTAPGVLLPDLHAAKVLVVQTIPSGPDAVAEGLRRVDPEEVHWFGQSASSDEIQSFLKRLAGICKGILKQPEISVSWERLGSACGQPIATVKLGIAWWVAKGGISIANDDAKQVKLMAGGHPVLTSLPAIEAQLRTSLLETSAFRSFYLRTNLDVFVQSLLKKSD